MRVGPDVDALPRQEFGGTGLVEEYERADHLSVRRGQRPSDFETAKIASSRNDQGLNRLHADLIRASWFDRRVSAHVFRPLLRPMIIHS